MEPYMDGLAKVKRKKVWIKAIFPFFTMHGGFS
jgi:hypothetical protein